MSKFVKQVCRLRADKMAKRSFKEWQWQVKLDKFARRRGSILKATMLAQMRRIVLTERQQIREFAQYRRAQKTMFAFVRFKKV